ncbi:hypothetical protein BDN71DRAFT_1504486 [Pleurotus eryngii]|uniref:Uncharacterized protein n=1 Tax=Pleurotus eryngii TaxID=5323 RepID=A0A9P6DIG6_PLEER|nr:hypothetical protein BDN71DRAFT_1504486 [Pleurotus eryngii]
MTPFGRNPARNFDTYTFRTSILSKMASNGALAAVQVPLSMNVDDALAMIDPVLRPGT